MKTAKGLFFVSFLLFAARLPANANEPTQAPTSSEEIELRVMVFDPTSMKEAWDQMLELGREFEEKNPGVKIRFLNEGGGGDPLTKLKIMLAGRQPIDVAAIDVLEFSSFLENDILLDLQPYLDQDPEWNQDDYFKVPLDAFRDGKGNIHGLPSTFTPYVMYVNTTILSNEGVSLPEKDWTWDDYLSIARKCTKETDSGRQWGVSITQWLQALSPWIWQNGGTLISEDLQSCTFDSPETKEALDFLVRLFHQEKVAATDATFEAQVTRGEFQDGNVALYGPVGYWEVYRFKEIKGFAWDVYPLPRGKQAATSIALRSYVGIGYTRHPELTARFIRLLSADRMSRTLARIGNGVPGFKKAARSEDFLKPEVLPRSENVFLDVLSSARLMPVHANWREIEHIIAQDLQDCLVLGKATASETGDRIAKKVNGFLAREREEKARKKAPLPFLGVAGVLFIAGCFVLFLIRRGPAGSLSRRKEERAGYGFITLWALGFVLLTLGPMMASFLLSLTVWTPIRSLDEARWAGIGNYERMLTDDDFWKAVAVTSEYSILSVPLSLLLALFLALLLRRGLTIFRTIFYLPTILSMVALGIIWRWVFGSDAVESLLSAPWIESARWIIPGFVFMSLWSVGGPMLIFLAGLQGIDPTLYEAARIDGASSRRQFFHVTLPQLSPLILFNIIMGLIAAFQTFAQPYVMTQGGPGNASLFYVLYLYKTAFRFQNMGYASALGWIMLLLLLVLCLFLLRNSRRWVHYEGEAT